MKKYLFTLCMASFFLLGCPPAPQYEYSEVAYKAFSRGSSEAITIRKNEENIFKSTITHFKNNKEVQKKEFKKKDFKKLHAIIKKIDLNTIDQLTVPSKKHQYDGAFVTTIEISVSDKLYRSVSFDHDNPPGELKPLVGFLRNSIQ